MAKSEVKMKLFFLCKGVSDVSVSTSMSNSKRWLQENNITFQIKDKMDFHGCFSSSLSVPPPHISLGPFMPESFAEMGAATMGRMH